MRLKHHDIKTSSQTFKMLNLPGHGFTLPRLLFCVCQLDSPTASEELLPAAEKGAEWYAFKDNRLRMG